MNPHSNNTLNHFALLSKQFFRLNGKIVLISVGGLIGGIFLLLLFIQRLTEFAAWNYEQFMYVFMGLFMVIAIIFAGSSFPGLRARDKRNYYLMIPISISEKFLFELLLRVVLFAVLLPVIYWTVFHAEAYLVHLFNPDFTFNAFSFTEGFRLPSQFENIMMMVFVIGLGMLFLTVPFFGSTVFMKHQIIKTAACAFGVLLIFFGLFNGFIQRNLGPHSLWVFNCFILLLNLILVVLAYFNLKTQAG